MGLRCPRAAEATFRLLAEQPEMGARAEFDSPLLKGMRMFPLKRFPKYLAFYRAAKSGIDVVRVIHNARNIDSLFESRVENGNDSLEENQEGDAT